MKKRILSKKSNPRIYRSPLNLKSKDYWVPVVAKNRDTLIGFIDGTYSASAITGFEVIDWTMLLSSERFNDMTTEDKKLSEMTKKELTEYVKNIILDDVLKSNHYEFTEDILSDYYFSVACSCGNFFGFKTYKEIPKSSMKCNICDRVIIHYTGKDDNYFTYDGKDINIDPYILKAKEELGIEDPLDEEE